MARTRRHRLTTIPAIIIMMLQVLVANAHGAKAAGADLSVAVEVSASLSLSTHGEATAAYEVSRSFDAESMTVSYTVIDG